MKPSQRSKEEYLNEMHRLGRIFVIIAIIIMLGLPTIIAIVYNSLPDFKLVFNASIGLLAVFTPIGISEMISYTPVLGSSIYLTLITGNVTNLKLPVVTNAFNLLKIEPGSEDADVISGIVVAVSTLTTLIIIVIGVVAMVPLRPILMHPVVETATSYMLPALFGCLVLGVFGSDLGGGAKAKGRLLGAIPAAVFMIVLTLLLPDLVTTLQGFLILFMLPITYVTTKYLFKKGIIKVDIPAKNSDNNSA